MTYVLTNLNHPEAGQPLWVKEIETNGRPEMVGMLRFTEAAMFDSAEAAEAALATIKSSTANFYRLSAQPLRSPFPAIGNNGWMKGHPGYDLG